MSKNDPTVFIVDDDKAVCSGISQLVETINLKTKVFFSGLSFLDSYIPDSPGCLVLDVRMPGISGLALQDELAAQNIDLPIIFITGHGNVKTGVETIKKGAIDYLEKPFDDQVLLDTVQKAIEMDAINRQSQAEKQLILNRIESLTPKENEIVYMVADGKLNKVIAYELEISQKTVEYHRSNIMKKMQVDSVAELVKLLERVGMLQ